MKYSLLALITLCMITGCAHKQAHKQNVFIFQGIENGKCSVDTKLSHWDAKTGAFVVVCKKETK